MAPARTTHGRQHASQHARRRGADVVRAQYDTAAGGRGGRSGIAGDADRPGARLCGFGERDGSAPRRHGEGRRHRRRRSNQSTARVDGAWRPDVVWRRPDSPQRVSLSRLASVAGKLANCGTASASGRQRPRDVRFVPHAAARPWPICSGASAGAPEEARGDQRNPLRRACVRRAAAALRRPARARDTQPRDAAAGRPRKSRRGS